MILMSAKSTCRKRVLKSKLITLVAMRMSVLYSTVELWYSRTTLILGVVFVFAYILSWGWMTYVMQETAKNSVSIRLEKELTLIPKNDTKHKRIA